MKPEIKQIYSPNVPAGLDGWRPADSSKFGITLQVFIGADDDDKFDSFDVVVCTPNWLAEKWEAGWFADSRLTDGVLSGHGVLLMKQWDHSDLLSALQKLVEQVDGNNWGDVANRLGRHLEWEYAYRYDDYQNQDRPFP